MERKDNDIDELMDKQSLEKAEQIRIEMKIFLFVEHEMNELLEKLESLSVATLSNAVAIGWRDAAESTLSLLIDKPTITSTIYFFYAVIMSVIGIYIVVRLNKYHDRRERLIIKYLDNINDTNTFESERKKLLKFAFTKRCINLIDSAIKFSIAWSWRMSINAFILAVYDDPNATETPDPVINQWGYTILITLFVAVLYAISDDYYIIYPRNTDSQKRYNTNTSRIVTNNILYDNLRFVVGMSWFDSLMISINISNADWTAATIAYWIIAIGGMSCSVLGTHYIKKFELEKKISHKGLTQAMFDTFERFYDPKCLIHDEDHRDMVPAVIDNTFFEILAVTIYGWGIAGSLSVTKAVTYTVYHAIPDWSDQLENSDPNTWGDDMDKENIYVLWIATVICLLITLTLTVYVGRLVNMIKEARRNLFKKLFKEKKKQLKKLQRQNRLPRNFTENNYDTETTAKPKRNPCNR